MTGTAEAVERQYRVMTISHAVDLWLGELARKNYSERTIDAYRRLLDKLAGAFPLADINDLTATNVRRFLDGEAMYQSGAGRKAAATLAQNVTIVNRFTDWATAEGLLARNPVRRNGERILSRPRQVAADENDNVATVSGTDVWRLIEATDGAEWNEKLAIHALAYIGPRRRALAVARIGDYDPVERMLSFREKGAKTIAKPVPDRLAAVIDAAIAAGVYVTQEKERGEDYLIPGRSRQRRPGDRDDRVIWHLVRTVAARAGVTTNVHALRAAFAVQYLETHPGQIEALQKLMGHRRLETTLVYLRRLNRRQQMESVRDMDWGVDGSGEIRTREPGFPSYSLSRRAPSATRAPIQGNKHFAGKPLESITGRSLLSLEPSFDPKSLLPTPSVEREASAPRGDGSRRQT